MGLLAIMFFILTLLGLLISILWITNRLRITEINEKLGLDITTHGHSAYRLRSSMIIQSDIPQPISMTSH